MYRDAGDRRAGAVAAAAAVATLGRKVPPGAAALSEASGARRAGRPQPRRAPRGGVDDRLASAVWIRELSNVSAVLYDALYPDSRLYYTSEDKMFYHMQGNKAILCGRINNILDMEVDRASHPRQVVVAAAAAAAANSVLSSTIMPTGIPSTHRACHTLRLQRVAFTHPPPNIVLPLPEPRPLLPPLPSTARRGPAPAAAALRALDIGY
ncbi:Protein of unknown function [Gryllus bimaculatus]|nr:Protein of unknown function [Gryllus bimaculatus]